MPSAPEPRPRLSGAPSTLVRDASAELAPFKRRRGPILPEVAQAELEDAAARDRIFDIVFDFSRQYFDYTAVFLVHGDLAEGRDGWGEGAPREKVARIGVPLDLPSALATARNKKARVRTLPDPEGLDAVLLADLGRRPTGELVVIPIVVRTRVVALLLGDGGEGGLEDGGVTEVESVVGHAVAAFERLIVRRKLQGTQPPGESAEVAARRDNPNLEGAVQVVIARAQHPSVPPAAEELAAPVRELMSEPLSTAVMTRREPPARGREGEADVTSGVLVGVPVPAEGGGESAASVDAPPPAHLLEVRRHAGPPIPREEPEAAWEAEGGSGPKTRVSGPGEMREGGQEPRRKSSGGLRKPEAPPLSFDGGTFGTYGATYGEDDVERRLLAEIEGREPAPKTEPDAPSSASPRAASPVPVAAPPGDAEDAAAFRALRPRGATDLSPGVMLPAHDEEAPVVAAEEDVTPRMPPVFADAEPAPVGAAPVASGEASARASARPAKSEIAEIASALKPKTLPPDAEASPETVKHGAVSSKKGRGRDKPMPASEQQVSIGAHRPPSSHEDVTRVLPAVIVDVEDEYEALVARVLEHDDEEAEADLLRAGAKAMPTIMSKFPGAITVARTLLEDGLMPRARDCGPVLRLVATQRRVALPHVLDRVESKNDDERIWSTYLLGELLYPEAVEAAVPRIFDEHPVVRRLARLALRALAEAHPGIVVDKLGSIAKGREQPTVRRTRAVEALGETREASSVPVLASLVNDTAGAVANAARIALVGVTRHDFGHDARAWFDWWDTNGERHRLEWLIDALLIDNTVLRSAAGEELKSMTKEYFGYYEDLPKREREKVQARYRQWWNEVGRVRFSRSLGPRSGG